MNPKSKISSNGIALSAIASISVFALYLYTLAPTVTLEDSGDFITAAYTLGVPHPSGFPLYTMLGKLLITIIPYGTVAWRVNLLSAIAAALTLFLLGLLAWRMTKKPGATIFTPLIFGVSGWFWSQAVIAEVYTLNTVFVAMLLYLLILWDDTRQPRYLKLIALVYGLSLTNHLMMLWFGPAILVYLFITGRKELFKLKILGSCVALFFLALLVYAYLPLAASFGPVKNWGDPSNLERFIKHITLAEYRGERFIVPLWLLLQALKIAAQDLWRQWFPALLILTVPGLFAFWVRKSIFRVWLTMFIPAFLFAVNASNIIMYNNYYYIPVYMLLAVLMALGIGWLEDRSAYLKYPATGILVIIIILTIIQNNAFASKRDYYLAEDFGRQFMNALPKNTLFVVIGDSYLFPAQYLQIVEGVRPDVEIMPAGEIASKKDIEESNKVGEGLAYAASKVIARELKKRPVCISQNMGLAKPLILEHHGLFYQVKYNEKPSVKPVLEPVRYRGVVRSAYLDIDNRQVLIAPYRLLSDYFGLQGDYQSALRYVDIALAKDPHSHDFLVIKGAYLFNQRRPDAAEPLFKTIVESNASDPIANKYLAYINYSKKQYKISASYLEKYLYFSPKDFVPDYYNDVLLLSNIYEQLGDYQRAVRIIEKNMEGQGNNPAADKARKKLDDLRVRYQL